MESKNKVVANALRAVNFTPTSKFEVGDKVRFKDSVRSVPHDEIYTVVKVGQTNDYRKTVTIKGGRGGGTSVEMADNLEPVVNAKAKNSAYTNYPNFRLMKRSAEVEMSALLRAIDEAAATIEKDARGFKNVTDASELEKGYIETCRVQCAKCLGEVRERISRQAKNVMQ